MKYLLIKIDETSQEIPIATFDETSTIIRSLDITYSNCIEYKLDLISYRPDRIVELIQVNYKKPNTDNNGFNYTYDYYKVRVLDKAIPHYTSPEHL